MKKLTKAQIKANRITQLTNELKQMIEEQGTTIYTRLLHISKSGMMRSIEVLLEDGTNISDMVSEIEGYTFHKSGGLKVTGCGMDMGFSVVYNLSCELYCKEKYEHDMAYKLKHKWV